MPITQRGDVTTHVLSRIKDLIIDGVLKPGYRLAPERELAKQFAVSRSSLRQALKVLNIIGVVSQKVGDGTYLNENASTILSEPMDFLVLLDGISLHELLEARLMLEPELASRAAERSLAEDLAAIRRTLTAMEERSSDLTAVVEADIAFHEAVCKASGNRICERMFSRIHRAFGSGIRLTAQLANPEHALSFHKEIYSAIYLRQPEQARQKMMQHLTDTRNLLLRASMERGLEMHDLTSIEPRGESGVAGKPLGT